MEPDYKNWVPKGMVTAMCVASVILGILWVCSFNVAIFEGGAQKTLQIVLGIIFILLCLFSLWYVYLYQTFSYKGKKQFAKRVIDRVSNYVEIPEGGTGLDVGCGSAALTIACARKNPGAKMVGLDRWGKEYASFNKPLCENNAKAEGVAGQVSFVNGDARKLPFEDETFDAVTGNYCIHNIPEKDRQAIILESLRILKKGGVFAIHDLFSKSKYGDMNILVNKLKDMGYEKVELLDTTNGLFMSPSEATVLCMKGSALLVGKK